MTGIQGALPQATYNDEYIAFQYPAGWNFVENYVDVCETDSTLDCIGGFSGIGIAFNIVREHSFLIAFNSNEALVENFWEAFNDNNRGYTQYPPTVFTVSGFEAIQQAAQSKDRLLTVYLVRLSSQEALWIYAWQLDHSTDHQVQAFVDSLVIKPNAAQR